MVEVQPMKIAFYRYSLLNRGGDRMVVNYANYLARSGHDVSFCLSVNQSVFEIDDSIKIVSVPWPGKAGFMAYGAVHRLPADLVIVDVIHLPLLIGLRNSLVYFAQADDVEYYGNWLGRRVMDILYRLYLQKRAAVITVDSRLTRVFSERYGFSGCHTVTNGIELDKFYPESDSDLIALKNGKKAVVFMARGDHFRKGFDLAMETFRLVNAGTADQMELWVCGEQLSGDNLPFAVRNFGVVQDGRLRQILSSADIFFYPSRHEGFGLFPLEAMACGCVVLTTDAVPYARQHACIATTEVGDAEAMLGGLEQLVTDVASFERMRRDVVSVARHYDIRKSCELFAATLLDIRNEVALCA